MLLLTIVNQRKNLHVWVGFRTFVTQVPLVNHGTIGVVISIGWGCKLLTTVARVRGNRIVTRYFTEQSGLLNLAGYAHNQKVPETNRGIFTKRYYHLRNEERRVSLS